MQLVAAKALTDAFFQERNTVKCKSQKYFLYEVKQ